MVSTSYCLKKNSLRNVHNLVFFRPQRVNLLDSTIEDSQPNYIPDSTCPEPLSSFVYIDDYNTIEKLRIAGAECHITTGRQAVRVHALKSEMQFKAVRELASTIKMKVNEKKTQLLCIHACTSSNINSYINTETGTICSSKRLKILGFYFNENPTAVCHATEVIAAFYRKLWMLRFLKKSGMPSNDILKVYCCIIRPAIEYCSVIYHSLIPRYVSDKLEQLQKQAMKVIYGYNIDYGKLVENGTVETLEERRIISCKKFALKNSVSRHANKWFPLNEVERGARASTRRKYREANHKTERSRNNPLQFMIRILNEEESKNVVQRSVSNT